MKGQNVGYIRVSSTSQNTERQLAEVQLDRTFTDKASGKDTNRPELSNCINHLREGDSLHVHSIDRLARNLKDLQVIIETLTHKGVTVKFYKEYLTFEASNSSPMQTLMLQMLGAFAEFERTLIKERQREGIEAAKARGQKLGAPSKLTSEQAAQIKARIDQGEDKSKVAKEFGISRPTLYKLLAA
ncbi:MAG: recombinase family protein [Methylococcaceae bacterium]|nr:recombinase family protein [Methylococcaceae bacterium]MDZ4219065.1 recombinase family protein [Methylobacter sp.]MDP2394122.1 recombinase family protein [Methylococcaceae bacterium]MDP3019149.1 recombinase family protein [Methylococcaceae bacterium]MDP3388688.1 recombinase family protein [Methylococcaceae bacterium]